MFTVTLLFNDSIIINFLLERNRQLDCRNEGDDAEEVTTAPANLTKQKRPTRPSEGLNEHFQSILPERIEEGANWSQILRQ